jgi:hypothetical protein
MIDYARILRYTLLERKGHLRMRVFIGLILGLGISTGLQASADDLCRREEKKILFAIDQICGDTWCEGDYNFQFRKIRCNFTMGTCALEFRTAPWKSGNDEEYDWSKSKVCVIRNVNSMDQLISTDRPTAELRNDPYEQITACIDHLEAKNLD